MIEGKAHRADGSVSVLALADFIAQEVTSLTQNKQQPTLHMSGSAKNFTLAKEASRPVVPVLVPAPAPAKKNAPKPRPKGPWLGVKLGTRIDGLPFRDED